MIQEPENDKLIVRFLYNSNYCYLLMKTRGKIVAAVRNK